MIRLRPSNTNEYVPKSQHDDQGKPLADAAVFIYRELTRREYTRIAELISSDEEGSGLRFELDTAYAVFKATVVGFRNIEFAKEDGSVIDAGTMSVERDEDDELPSWIVDAFHPRDVFEFSRHIVNSSQLGVREGGK